MFVATPQGNPCKTCDHTSSFAPFCPSALRSTRGQPLLLDAVIADPLRGLKFWWNRGFRTNNVAVDGYLSRNLFKSPRPKATAIESALRKAQGFNYQEEYMNNNSLLKMTYL
jgi:hypothetical protein